MKKVISVVLATVLALTPLTYIKPEQVEAQQRVSQETKITSSVAKLPEGNVALNTDAQYGFGQKLYYRDFQNRAAMDVKTPFWWRPYDRQYRYSQENIASNISVERIYDETDQKGNLNPNNSYRLYKINFFPYYGIKYEGYERSTFSYAYSNLHMGFGLTKDLQIADVSVIVHFSDGSSRSTSTVRRYSANRETLLNQNNKDGIDSWNSGNNSSTFPGMAHGYITENNWVEDELLLPDGAYGKNALRLHYMSSKPDDTNPEDGWFYPDIWYPGQAGETNLGAKAEYDKSDLGTAITWRTGVDPSGNKDFYASYEVYVRAKVIENTPTKPNSFSGVLAGYSSYQSDWMVVGGDMNGYKKESRQGETIKVVYREHYNGIKPQAITQHLVGVVKAKHPSVSNDTETKGGFQMSPASANTTAARGYTETTFGISQPLDRRDQVDLNWYANNVSFIPNQVDGYTLRTQADGKKYTVSSTIENGIKVLHVDTYYDADIIDASTVTTAPNGYEEVRFKANPTLEAESQQIHQFKPGEISSFYVRTAANKRISDIPAPALRDIDVPYYTGMIYKYDKTKPVNTTDVIDGFKLINYNYLEDIVIVEPPVDVKHLYWEVTFSPGVQTTFQNGNSTTTTPKKYWVLKSAQKKFADLEKVSPLPVPVANAGFRLLSPLWQDETSVAVENTSTFPIDANKTFTPRTASILDTIQNIKILSFKQDHWVYEYFDASHITYPLTVELTDINNRKTTVKYSQTIDGKKAFDYYGLELFVPSNMVETGMHEEVVAGVKRIALPGAPTKNLSIGVRVAKNPSISAISDPQADVNNEGSHPYKGQKAGIYTWYSNAETDPSFWINVLRKDTSGQWVTTNEVPVNTPIRVDLGYSDVIGIDPNKVSQKAMVRIPGFNSLIEMTRLPNKMGNSYVFSVSGIVPTLPTKNTYLDRIVPDKDAMVQASGKTAVLDILPPVITRGSNTSAPKSGFAGDYNRLSFRSDSLSNVNKKQTLGWFENNLNKEYYRIFDIQKDVTFAQAKEYIATQNLTLVVEPTAVSTHSFNTWKPTLPTDNTKLIADKTIEATYTQKAFDWNSVSDIEIVKVAHTQYIEGQEFVPRSSSDENVYPRDPYYDNSANFQVKLTDVNGNTETVSYDDFETRHIAVTSPQPNQPLTIDKLTDKFMQEYYQKKVVVTYQGNASGEPLMNSVENQETHALQVKPNTSPTPISGYYKVLFKKGAGQRLEKTHTNHAIVTEDNKTLHQAEVGDVVIYVNPVTAASVSYASIEPTAIPTTGNTHVGWTEDNNATIKNSPLTGNVDGNKTLTAAYLSQIIPDTTGVIPNPNTTKYATVTFKVSLRHGVIVFDDRYSVDDTANNDVHSSVARYYVDKSAGITLKTITDRIRVDVNTGYGQNDPFWIPADGTEAFATALEKPITGDMYYNGSFFAYDDIDVVERPGYKKVTFLPGDHGELTETKQGSKKSDGSIVLWVNPKVNPQMYSNQNRVRLGDITPQLSVKSGDTDNWAVHPTAPWGASYSADTEITQSTPNEETYTGQFVEIVTTSPVDPTLYHKVSFKPGDHGRFNPESANVDIYVLKNKGITWEKLTSRIPSVVANADWSHIGWSEQAHASDIVSLPLKQNGSYAPVTDGVYTARYSESIVKKDDNTPKPSENFIEVTFKATPDQAVLKEGQAQNGVSELTYYVDTTKNIQLSAVASKFVVEAKTGFAIDTTSPWKKAQDNSEVWAATGIVESNKIYSFETNMTRLPDISPIPLPGYVHVSFNKGAYGKLTAPQNQTLKETTSGYEVWVAPDRGVTLSTITPQGAIDENIEHAREYMIDSQAPWGSQYVADHQISSQDVAQGLSYTLQFKKIVIDNPTTPEPPAGYVRVQFNAGEGYFGTQNVKAKTYDVLQEASWDTFTSLIGGVPTAAAPTDKPNFLDWKPLLPSVGTDTLATIAQGQKSLTYTATFGADVVVAQNPDSDDDKPHASKYVSVRFDGVDGKAQVKQDNAQPVAHLKYYVIKDKATVSFPYEVTPVFGIGFEQNGTNPWTKDNENVAFNKGPRSFANDETYTVSVKESPDVSNVELNGYTKVSFAPGLHGSLTPKQAQDGTSYGVMEQDKVVMWVNPTKELTLKNYAPQVSAHVGYSHSGWTNETELNVAKKHTSAVDTTATYTQNSDYSKEPIAGYWRVAFKQGDAESLDANDQTVKVTTELLEKWRALDPQYVDQLSAGDVVVWVNPVSTTANLSALEPHVHPGQNKTLVGWTSGQSLLLTPLNKQITGPMDLTPSLSDSIIPNPDDKENPNPAVYVSVKLTVDPARGVMKHNNTVRPTGVLSFFVDKNANKTLGDVVSLVEVEANLGFEKKTPLWVADDSASPVFNESTKITTNAAYHADFTTLADVLPEPKPGYVEVRFNKGEGGNLESRKASDNQTKLGKEESGNVVYYVNPSKGVKLEQLTPAHAPQEGYVPDPFTPWKHVGASAAYNAQTTVVKDATYEYTAQYFAKVKDGDTDTVPQGFTRITLNAGEGTFSGDASNNKTRSIDVYSDVTWDNPQLVQKIAGHKATLVAPTQKPAFINWKPVIPQQGVVSATDGIQNNTLTFVAQFAAYISPVPVEGYTKIEFVPGEHGVLTEKIPGTLVQKDGADKGKVIVYVHPDASPKVIYNDIVPTVTVKESSKQDWAVHPEKPWGNDFDGAAEIGSEDKTFTPVFIPLVTENPDENNKHLYFTVKFASGEFGTFATEKNHTEKTVYVLKPHTSLGTYQPTWALLQGKVPVVTVNAGVSKSFVGWNDDSASDPKPVLNLPLKENDATFAPITSNSSYTAAYRSKEISQTNSTLVVEKKNPQDNSWSVVDNGVARVGDELRITVNLRDEDNNVPSPDKRPSTITVTVPGVTGNVTLTWSPDTSTYVGTATPTQGADGLVKVTVPQELTYLETPLLVQQPSRGAETIEQTFKTKVEDPASPSYDAFDGVQKIEGRIPLKSGETTVPQGMTVVVKVGEERLNATTQIKTDTQGSYIAYEVDIPTSWNEEKRATLHGSPVVVVVDEDGTGRVLTPTTTDNLNVVVDLKAPVIEDAVQFDLTAGSNFVWTAKVSGETSREAYVVQGRYNDKKFAVQLTDKLNENPSDTTAEKYAVKSEVVAKNQLLNTNASVLLRDIYGNIATVSLLKKEEQVKEFKLNNLTSGQYELLISTPETPVAGAEYQIQITYKNEVQSITVPLEASTAAVPQAIDLGDLFDKFSSAPSELKRGMKVKITLVVPQKRPYETTVMIRK